MLDSTQYKKMTNFSRRIQQAPWRTRRQTVGAILLAIVGISMVIAFYLDVATRTTLVGREIQLLEWETSQIKAENANLKTELAHLLSYHEIESRSAALGFRRATAAEMHYLLVPGYAGKAAVSLVTEAPADDWQNELLTEAYTRSLFDWFDDQMRGGN